MPTTEVFPTAVDAEYFRIRPWIEIATRQMVCTAETCGNTIDPGEEIVRDDDRGGMHVDCVLAEMLQGDDCDNCGGTGWVRDWSTTDFEQALADCPDCTHRRTNR